MRARGASRSPRVELAFLVTAVCVLLLVPVRASAQAERDLDTVLRELETLANEVWDPAKVPGFAYAVVEGSEPVYARGFGRRSLDAAPGSVVEHTLFEIGSCTKAFTATIGPASRSGPLSPLGNSTYQYHWSDWPSNRTTILFKADGAGNVTKLILAELTDVRGGGSRRSIEGCGGAPPGRPDRRRHHREMAPRRRPTAFSSSPKRAASRPSAIWAAMSAAFHLFPWMWAATGLEEKSLLQEAPPRRGLSPSYRLG